MQQLHKVTAEHHCVHITTLQALSNLSLSSGYDLSHLQRQVVSNEYDNGLAEIDAICLGIEEHLQRKLKLQAVHTRQTCKHEL